MASPERRGPTRRQGRSPERGRPAVLRWTGEASRAGRGHPPFPEAPEDGPSPLIVVGHSYPLHPRPQHRYCCDYVMSTAPWRMDAERRYPVSLQPGQQNCGPSCTLVKQALLALTIPLSTLKAVKGLMLQFMNRGLSCETHSKANMQMLPTYVCSMPDGTEKGAFLAVELCQSHVRTQWVNFLGDGNQSPQVLYKIFDMPRDILQGKGEELFDFIAKCVQQFLAGIGCPQNHLLLGFVFPFSCRHTQLDKAELICWSKGFSCSDVEGKDVVQLLQSAIKKQKLYHVDVVALVNDTVDIMMSCSMWGKYCEVALIVDKGTNSCFMAEAQQVEMVDSGQMSVNTEWGYFGDDGSLSDILTPYDLHVDQESSNPGEKRFEKLVGSLYLGEIVRHVLITLAAEKALFIGRNVTVLRTKGVLKAQQILDIISSEGGMEEAERTLKALGLQPSEWDCCQVQQVCWAVVSRAATLCAAGLAAILSHMCQSRKLDHLLVNVAVNGDLCRSTTRFVKILQSVTGLLAPECTATLVPAGDGNGQGVAMVIAVALRVTARHQEVNQLLAPLRLSRSDLERVQVLMRREMELGLGQETNANSSVRMLPTYVRGTPDGTEKGKFLALDLGGTNFRVLVVHVTDNGIHMASKICIIPTAIMQGTGEELFDHIIECIMDFQLKQALTEQVLPLGFTFSFPCQQLGLDKAVLLSWTKGFSASGCVGQDVVQLLREAAQRKQHSGLKVVAVVNDTVGTMMACGHDDPNCEIGLIVGTGTNACYMEEMQNVGTVEGEQGRMCINMEWGAFGDNGCLDDFFTDFDQLVDKQSINVGKQRFEKLISGMYLGEIVRHILLALVEKQLLFCGKPCPKLQMKDIFQTKFLSTIELEGLGLQQVQTILKDLEVQATREDSMLVREVCQTVSLRAAHLCAAALAAVVEKMRENRGLAQLSVTVGVDGTLYKMHPCFSQHLQQTLRDLAPNCTVTFLISEDGSGKGAALVAAVACRGTEP